MPAGSMSTRDRAIYAVYGVFYYIVRLFLRLSNLPLIGRIIERFVYGRQIHVVTVGAKFQSTSAVMPYDVVKRLVEEAAYVAAADSCMCRVSRGCKDYPRDLGCIYLGSGARSIKYKAHEITRDEALERLDRSRSLGLVNNVVWSADEFKLLGADYARTVEICSCCPCCCLMFRTRDASRAFIDGIIGLGTCKVTDADLCTRCTNCVSACPFKAISVDLREGPSIDEARCKGCGRCEAACRAKVLKVFPKPDNDPVSEENGYSNTKVRELIERFQTMVR